MMALAASRLTEIARELEVEGLHDDAFDLDLLAHRLEKREAAREAQEAARIAHHDAECERYEQTTGRDFDRWARAAPTEQLQQRMGAA